MQFGKHYARRLVAWRPRLETSLLFFSLLVTVMGKLLALSVFPTPPTANAGIVFVSDLLFFLALLGLMNVVYAVFPSLVSARVLLILTALILLWSGANAAWLYVTGVQLHAGVLTVVLRHPAEFWPTVRPHVLGRRWTACAVGLLSAVVAGWIIWRCIRPVAIARRPRQYGRRAVAALGVVLCLAVAQALGFARAAGAPQNATLVFSSHTHALRWMAMGNDTTGSGNDARSVPRSGERSVELPIPCQSPRPNIVLVLLESISYTASGLDDPRRGVMPTLALLSATGIEFTDTRVPVPQTGKALWATLTGTTPDVAPDFTEAVLVDRPYESLPTLLRRSGYRSAFFQMSRGSFECAPGTFANFGFDWAWFRENLEDPEASLSTLTGDDFRMLDPAFAWAESDQRPFLLVLITSVAHEPFLVPDWFETPADTDEQRYEQAVRFTDAFLAELRRRVAELGPDDETLLCVLGDHGQSFRPGIRRLRWIPYEEIVRVPWVLHWPGHLPAGLRCAGPSSQLDVTPTLLSVVGYDVSGAGFDGRDARAPVDPNRRLYCAAWFEGSPFGYTEAGRKWLYWPTTDCVTVYDLAADPGEESPLLVVGPQRERMIADARNWRQASRLSFDSRRFRKRFLYGHWWTFSSGRYARAYYVP